MTLYQASAENKEPTRAEPIAAISANPIRGIVWFPGPTLDACQKISLLISREFILLVARKPIVINPKRAITLVEENIF